MNHQISYSDNVLFALSIINLVGSSISLLCLLLVLFILVCKKKIKFFVNELLLYITISEICNSISKFLDLCKKIDVITSSSILKEIIISIQVILSIFSDFCTLITSLLISLKFYDSLKNNSICFNKKCLRVLARITCIGGSLVLAGVFFSLDRFLFGQQDQENKWEKDYWTWVAPKLSLIIYGIVLLIIIVIIVISCKTISYLRKKRKEFSDADKESSIDEGSNHTSKVEDKEKRMFSETLITEQIEKVMGTFYKYPFVSTTIWLILGVYRVTEDVYLIKELTPSSNVMTILTILVIIHSLISSLRGVIYFFAYFRSSKIVCRDFIDLFMPRKVSIPSERVTERETKHTIIL